MKPNASISVKLFEQDLKIDVKFEPGKEGDLVALLLALCNQELYVATLNYIKEQYDTGKMDKESYLTILNTLKGSLKIIQSQQEDALAIKPSQVFR